jgi:hypothetical protein
MSVPAEGEQVPREVSSDLSGVPLHLSSGTPACCACAAQDVSPGAECRPRPATAGGGSQDTLKLAHVEWDTEDQAALFNLSNPLVTTTQLLT